jgi:endonuclease YncB( thermonuclease family)
MMIRVFLFSLLGLLSMGPAAALTYTGKVTRVIDGDTVSVQSERGGRAQRLRLQGLDAPESCQSGGAESTQALVRMVLGQRVQVDVEQTDVYGRGLAHLSLQGEDVGARLVREGQAWSYRWKANPGPYLAEERQARSARRGLFAQARPELPRHFRKRHGPCPRSFYAKSPRSSGLLVQSKSVLRRLSKMVY